MFMFNEYTLFDIKIVLLNLNNFEGSISEKINICF